MFLPKCSQIFIIYRFLQNPFLMVYQFKYETKGRTRLSELRMRTVVLPRWIRQKRNKKNILINTATGSISLDGVTDCSGNSIVAVMLIDGRTKHYIGNLDLGKDEHSAVNLVDALTDLLGVRFNSCKAIV